MALLTSIIVDADVDPVDVYVCSDNDEIKRKCIAEPKFFHEQSLTQNFWTPHCKNITYIWGSLLSFWQGLREQRLCATKNRVFPFAWTFFVNKLSKSHFLQECPVNVLPGQ